MQGRGRWCRNNPCNLRKRMRRRSIAKTEAHCLLPAPRRKRPGPYKRISLRWWSKAGRRWEMPSRKQLRRQGQDLLRTWTPPWIRPYRRLGPNISCTRGGTLGSPRGSQMIKITGGGPRRRRKLWDNENEKQRKLVPCVFFYRLFCFCTHEINIQF